ncbi:MAG: hypothetical protein ABSF69_08860 [Polyangiaceae bacterium]|jgi:hypothetical protein
MRPRAGLDHAAGGSAVTYAESPSRLWASVFLLGALPGCITATVRGGYCAPPSRAALSLAPDPPPGDSAPREEHVAALVGLSGMTAEVTRSDCARVQIVERVELASLAIGAASAELDCESERAEQAADYLARAQATSVQGLTIGSIAAATLTGIAGVFLSTRGAPALAQDTLAVSGGTVTAGLGLASFFVPRRTSYEHERNLLADVWVGPATSETYPPVIWTYLTRAAFSNSQRAPIRDGIVGRWKQFQQVADSATAAMLFGRGGSYDVDSLRLRAAMLDEVRAEVELARQDLAALAANLLR